MNKLNKQFHRVFLESLQERGGSIPKVEWHPILMEKRGYASSFSVKVNLRETMLKIYNSNADEKLRTGRGWDLSKMPDLLMPKQNLRLPPSGFGIKKERQEWLFKLRCLLWTSPINVPH